MLTHGQGRRGEDLQGKGPEKQEEESRRGAETREERGTEEVNTEGKGKEEKEGGLEKREVMTEE